MEKKKKKAHQFSFKKEGEELFDNEKISKKSNGRPKKPINEKVTKQYTIQLKESDDKNLREEFNNHSDKFSNFASYLRYKVLKGF